MQYTTHIEWQRNEEPFTPKSYDRTHDIRFGGSSTIKASSAPEFAGLAELPNPEELFTASISSCFMLTFLYSAALKGLQLETYTADATGTLAKNSDGKMAVTEVNIKPQVTFTDNQQPDATLLQELFKKAHENCFITSSVKTKVNIVV